MNGTDKHTLPGWRCKGGGGPYTGSGNTPQDKYLEVF